MRVGAEIMLEEINKHPMLLKGFDLKVVWQDGQCTKDVCAKLFMENLLHDIYTVFAPGVAVGDLDADQRAKLRDIVDKCPVHRTLERSSTVETVLLDG